MGVPFKRPAADKSGIPVYQPGTTYQQLMQLQQPYVPVSCEYPSPSPSTATTTANPQSSTANSIISNNINNNNNNAAVNNSNNSSHTSNSTGGNILLNNNSIATAVTSSASIMQQSPLLNHNINHNSSPQHKTLDSRLAQQNTNEIQIQQQQQTMSSQGVQPTPATVPGVVSTPLIPTQPPIANTVPFSSYSATPFSSFANAAIYSHALTTQASNQTLFADPAALAKEVAQKNYANALKLAAASNAYSGKPLTALNYTGVALNKALIPQQNMAAAAAAAAAAAKNPFSLWVNPKRKMGYPTAAAAAPAATAADEYAAAARQFSSIGSVANANAVASQAQLSLAGRPAPMLVQSHQFLRHPVTSPAAATFQNPNQSVQMALANAAQQQLLFYPGMGGHPGYPFNFGAPGAAGGVGLPAHMGGSLSGNMTTAAAAGHHPLAALGGIPTVPQVPAGQTPGSAVVLNPYKKMKTS